MSMTSRARTERYDLVILGSGSTAFAAAIRAAEFGKRVVMTEARTLGGTCVNRGCLPSKNLIGAAEAIHAMRHPRYPGIQPAEPRIDFAALIRQKDELIAQYRQKKYASIVDADARIDLVMGAARFIDPHVVAAGDRLLYGEQVLIATGTRPTRPPIAGLEQAPHLTSDLLASGEPMELTELPRSLLIVGGGYIALELGQLFARLGVEVTIVHRGDRLLSDPTYEPEVSAAIQTVFEAEGIRLALGATVQRVRHDGAIILTVLVDGREIELRAEQLLIAAGRTPNTDAIGIDAAGVRLTEGGHVEIDSSLRTNVPHIWAAGDVVGRQTSSQPATPVGAHDGGIAAENALAGAAIAVDHAVIPRVIFTDPPIGLVGWSDAEANAAGVRCRCTSVPMELVPRAAATHDPRGVVKMVIEAATERVLGVQMAGQAAHEVIHEAAMGLRFHAARRDFVDLIHVYPAMAEALKIVALSFEKDVRKLSCCAE